MKTEEKLNTLKEEAKALNEMPHDLTDRELLRVNGGTNESGYTGLGCSSCHWQNDRVEVGSNGYPIIRECPNCHRSDTLYTY